MWRVVLGFLLAPLAGATAGAAVLSHGNADHFRSWLTAFSVASYIDAYIFGLLTFIALNGVVRPTLIRVSLTGSAVALALSVLLGAGYFVMAALGAPFSLMGALQFFGTIAGMGLVGGFVFWLIVYTGHEHEEPDRTPL
ncbi:hypothetical protein U8607_10760 [Methylobacterium durans]|uniref:hypothetical protein n=1 Tax=Methylobacterium durans TaxID=2202825 RepID=UPI002B002DAF|nr:hypothetical protein [Methylobacterium durans]MEA1832562.1 hypothetical protein [Methylobacterium durans]